MSTLLIKQARIVNEGEIYEADLFIKDGLIHEIGTNLTRIADRTLHLNSPGKYLIPGVIDDQVHFREPGLTHKADIHTESRAAIAGGITSFMEMPNTVPQTLTQELLEAKYQRAAETSMANYSFFMGASNDNLEEVKKTDPKNVCGVKVFMGSSTGNMLVDDEVVLENIFRHSPTLVATHCEHEATIKRNLTFYTHQFGDDIPIKFHPHIRNEQACWESSRHAVELALKHGTRLHILHISTARELNLFRNDIPLSEKKITAEACIHHLWFTDEYYEDKGTLIKWNPAVKTKDDREAIRQAVRQNRIDVIATDHAPHTLAEKQNPYTKAPSGGPMVQHALVTMLEMVRQGVFTLELVVNKMCHAPAECFNIYNRGYIREGYAADLVVIDMDEPWYVDSNNVHYKCGWSPLEGTLLHSKVCQTILNGELVYDEGQFDENIRGQRLQFVR